MAPLFDMKIKVNPMANHINKLNFHWKTFGNFCSRPTPLIGESKNFMAPAFMDYTQHGFCDLKEIKIQKKIVSPS